MKDQRVPGNGVLVGFANQLPSDLSLFLKDEGIIGKVICRHRLCGCHDLQHIDPCAIHRSGNARLSGRDNPTSNAGQGEGGNGEKTEFAHWNPLPSNENRDLLCSVSPTHAM